MVYTSHSELTFLAHHNECQAGFWDSQSYIIINSSLHWLDMGFLYALFVQWSIYFCAKRQREQVKLLSRPKKCSFHSPLYVFWLTMTSHIESIRSTNIFHCTKREHLRVNQVNGDYLNFSPIFLLKSEVKSYNNQVWTMLNHAARSLNKNTFLAWF